MFVGLQTLKLGVTDAVICFNEGFIAKANVLERMKIKPSKFMIEGLKYIDCISVLKAEKDALEQTKKQRIKRRLCKRKQEDTEDEDYYCPGGF